MIERLWKYVKNNLRSKCYNDFNEFKATIDTIIDEAGKSYKAIIDKLIGESIQIFDALVPISSNTFVNKCVGKEIDIVA